MTNQLNKFTFYVYTQSPYGQLALEYFQDLNKYTEDLNYFSPFMGVNEWIANQIEITEGQENQWEKIPLDKEEIQCVEAVRQAAKTHSVSNADEIRKLLVYLVNSNTIQLSDDTDDTLSLNNIFSDLPLISMGLHLAHPDIFLPYGFTRNYYYLQNIAEEFSIPLPPIPPKNDRLERWLFYGQLCLAFQEFGKLNDLNLPGLLAFMYNFGPNYIASKSNLDLPEPRNAWLLIGGVDNGDLDWMNENITVEQTNWQGNLDMRRGDVCIMYIRAPLSSTHSIWRVVEDAYEDPFFHYKHTVQIGFPQKVPAIHSREIIVDSVLSRNKYVKANLRGASGKALSHAEYHRFLELMRRRGSLPENIPQFPEQQTIDLSELGNERDVEIKLVEPLLHRAGLEIAEWQRQLSVRMGRGERVYPDYAIGLTGKAPEQRAKALVEVKYRAAGERDWREAFLQVKSYGLRLGAQVILTAAAEGVRVYERKNDDFDFTQGTELKWSELQEGEKLRWLSRLLKS